MFQRNLEYDEIQDEVAARVPGWEQLQEVCSALFAKFDDLYCRTVDKMAKLTKII